MNSFIWALKESSSYLLYQMKACYNFLVLLVLKVFLSLDDWDKIFLVFEEEIAHYTADLPFNKKVQFIQ